MGGRVPDAGLCASFISERIDKEAISNLKYHHLESALSQ